MDIINTEEIKSLATYKGPYCTSIYIPTHVSGKETYEGEDIIRFKNIIQKVEGQLLEFGMKKRDVDTMLEKPKALINDSGFWRKQSEGLAVFISKEHFKYYKIPLSFEPVHYINSKFHLKPILPLFFTNGNFYLLALSKDAVKFFHCTRHTISKIDLEDLVPQGMEEALMYDDPKSTLQHHSGQGGTANAMFHGQGGGRDVQKTDIARYLNVVDEGLMKIIKGDRTPMVIAAVDYLIPIYKSVSKYANIMEDGVLGNPEHTDENDLHAGAWEIVESYFMRNQRKALNNYRENGDASLVTASPDRIIPAAYYKQINQLFILRNAVIWGNFNESKGALTIRNTYKEGDDDLINEAAVHTFLNGGEVYELSEDEMPDEHSKLAAVLRFA
jgi:hypothetical protein